MLVSMTVEMSNLGDDEISPVCIESTKSRTDKVGSAGSRADGSNRM